MTLVVARKTGNVIWLIGDTLFSGGPQSLRERDTGLKIFAVGKSTLIAYSGSPEIAHDLIRRAALRRELATAGDIAQSIRRDVGTAKIDFIVAHSGHLAQVKDGRVVCDLNVSNIGDLDSVLGKYHQHLEAARREENGMLNVAGLEIVDEQTLCGAGKSEFCEGRVHMRAMELLIGDLSVATVGGEVVIALNSCTGSRYLSYSSAFSAPSTPKPASRWMKVDFGNASSGGYCFTTITPEDAGVSGWGAFYQQAGFGKYYCADVRDGRFERYTGYAANADEFSRLVTKHVGYQVKHCGSFG